MKRHYTPPPGYQPYTGHFAQFRAMAMYASKRLTLVELRVAIYFLMRTNNETGLAWPTPKRIAADLGLTKRNVQKAIAGLTTKGLLLTVYPGGCGVGNPTVRRVNFELDISAEIVSELDTNATGQTGEVVSELARNQCPNAQNIVSDLARQQRPNQTPNHIREHNIKQHSSPAYAGSLDVDVFSACVKAELEAAGVTGSNLTKLAQIPGLTALHILLLRREAKAKGIKNPGGWIYSSLSGGNGVNPLPHRLKPEIVCAMANEGRIASIAGKALNDNAGQFRWNSTGLMLDGKVFAQPHELTPASIMLTPPPQAGDVATGQPAVEECPF